MKINIRNIIKKISRKEKYHKKYVFKKRRTGKTVSILIKASEDGGCVIVSDKSIKICTELLADKMLIPCPDIYTLEEVRNGALRGCRYRTIYIDNLDLMINQLLIKYGAYGKIEVINI